MNWDSIRDEFPALREWTYLNTATFGQLPRRTTEAVARHFAHRDELACSDFLKWYDDMDRVRASIGRLIHCRPEDVAFITNASSALALVLAGLEWHAGDRIVTLTDEFPNNLYAPHGLEERGVEFVECAWEQIHETVHERTRLVVVSSANYNTGFVPPLAELSKLCKSHGAVLFVDGTQSLGALRFDVGEMQPDVLAVHGYKWLISPTGAECSGLAQPPRLAISGQSASRDAGVLRQSREIRGRRSCVPARLRDGRFRGSDARN